MSVEKLKALRQKREELSVQIKESAKTLFKEASVTLFNEFPNLVKFGWTQYTPYFNDGDSCEFSSNHNDPFIIFTSQAEEDGEDFSPWDYEFNRGDYGTFDYKSSPYTFTKNPNLTAEQEAEYAAGSAVLDFLKNFDDTDMMGMFGDHQIVTVSKDGVDTSDYDHE
jgi:hypothetical protein